MRALVLWTMVLPATIAFSLLPRTTKKYPDKGTYLGHHDSYPCGGDPLDDDGKRIKHMTSDGCISFDPKSTAIRINMDNATRMKTSQIDLYDNEDCKEQLMETVRMNNDSPYLCIGSDALKTLPKPVLAFKNRTADDNDKALTCNDKTCHSQYDVEQGDIDVDKHPQDSAWISNFDKADCSGEPTDLKRTYLKGRYQREVATPFKPTGAALGVHFTSTVTKLELFKDEACTELLGTYGWGHGKGGYLPHGDVGLCMTRETHSFEDVRCVSGLSYADIKDPVLYCHPERNTCVPRAPEPTSNSPPPPANALSLCQAWNKGRGGVAPPDC